MALFHLSVTQTKRSAGQSAIASAAYRAGERLYSEYYGEYSDYTRKGGVICSDILLPSHAPPEYADRQTLWNAVEKAERGKNAQLAYSFDIALQNEFSLEENIALARQFLLENFVSRGMVVDFAVHQPDREDGGIPNPHFHVLCPIRPIEQNGKWGLKQRRVYELDEDGNRIRDANGKFVFNAVPTTDWGSPETLEHWRQTWAELRKETFSVKIVRDSAVRQEPAQPQAVSPEENRFSIRPRQIALFFLWMLAFTLLARGTSGALLPEVQLSTPAPNTITQSLTATGTIQWAAGSLFYLPEGLLVEAVFVSEGEAVQEGDKIAALRREDVEQKLRSLQAELAQKQTEYARLTKPVAADSYDLEKAQQALQAAYQAAENSAAAWAEKEANAGSERDALQRELNERQEKAAQYAREIAEKQAQRELLQQEESPDEEIISRIEAELTQLTAEETQNREALAEAEARLNEADAALESVQSQREEAARTAAQAAEQAEQARNDARHAYEKSVEAASETAAANAASATVLAEQIREMESSVETLKKLDEQEGVFCAPQTGTVESLQLMQGQTSGQVGGSISDPERGYQIRFALEAEDAVQDTAGVTVTVMQGAKSESVKINSSVSQQDGGVVLSAALTGSDWQVGKAELTIRLSETEYDCCLPVSALHSDNGGDFVYSVEERNTILGLQNIVRKVYVEVVERNNELAALRNYTTGAPVVAATTKSLQEGARVRTAG